MAIYSACEELHYHNFSLFQMPSFGVSLYLRLYASSDYETSPPLRSEFTDSIGGESTAAVYI